MAVVTGASRGIGKAIALALAEEGCNVVVNYEKNRDKADKVVETIRKTNRRAVAIACNVSNRNEVENMFKTTITEFGRVDILVNNAGIAIEVPILEVTDDVWDWTMNVNLKGVFLCTQVAARHMVEKKYGKIVNIASNSGFGVAVWGETPYAASKAAVIQLTKNAAFELGKYGINVNCVAPGAVDTDMLKGKLTDQQYAELIKTKKTMSSLGILGEPRDISNTVLFFASDESRFITGKTLLVDGGRRDFI